MERARDDTPEIQPSLAPVRLRPLTLRFLDEDVEAAFRADYFRHAVSNYRFGLVAGIVLWVVSGIFLYPRILALADKRLDVLMRLTVFIPLLLLGIGLSFTRFFHRIYEWVAVGIALATMGAWVFYISQVLTIPAEYGYIGVILITSFTYALLRLRFVLVVLITVVGIAAYLPYAVDAVHIVGITTVLAALFLISFGVVGCIAAYRMERSQRLLFLREHQLRLEHERSDRLLLNVLPQVIVDRLKNGPQGRRVADALPEVTVVFADLVDSTREAVSCSPDEFAGLIEELFSAFDQLVDRHGLEKIKTVGDAYMAVAGAPVQMPNSAGAAAAAALDMLETAHALQWPSGRPVELRIGVATGPAVAGVIGKRKFAYDLWGDTVNLASRLQESADPGQILLSESTADRLNAEFELSGAEMRDVKGRGTTQVRSLQRRGSRLEARPTGT